MNTGKVDTTKLSTAVKSIIASNQLNGVAGEINTVNTKAKRIELKFSHNHNGDFFDTPITLWFDFNQVIQVS